VKKCEEKRGQLEKYIYREKNIKIRKKKAAGEEAKGVGKNCLKFLTKHFNNLLTL